MNAWVRRPSHMPSGFGDTGSGIRVSIDMFGAAGAGPPGGLVTSGMTEAGGTHVGAGRGEKDGGSVPMTGAGITTIALSGGMTPTVMDVVAATTVDSATNDEQTRIRTGRPHRPVNSWNYVLPFLPG